MAGSHNFKVYDSTNANMTPDAAYEADPARLNGAQPNSMADPLSANKAWHQATIMSAAIAQYMANQGISIADTNLVNLVSGISYADRMAHGLFGIADVGQIIFCAAQSVPATATYAAGAAGNLLGGYHYREVFISGYKNPDGTYFVRGFSPAAQRSGYDVSPSSQQVSITNLPIGGTGCIGRAIYRSAANGAAGSEKFCGIIWDNTVTTYTDNLVDSQLGAGMPTVQGVAVPSNVPTSNTTGTVLSVEQVNGAVDSATIGGAAVTKSGTTLQLPAYPVIPSSLPANGGTADYAHYSSHAVGSGGAALRNITMSTAGPSGGSDGDVWHQYS